MAVQQTGIFFVNTGAQSAPKEFPREFRRSPLSSLDRRFAFLLVVCGLALGTLTFLLSLRDVPEEASEKEILKIQERYAQLVLNQPKPKIEKEEESGPAPEQAEEPAEEKPEEEQVDREKETFTEKQERKARNREERQRKRAEVAKQVQSAGIFAAITSAGGGGGVSSSAADLLGAADAVSDLNNLNVSKGAFATKKDAAAQVGSRRGSRTSGVGIEKKQVGKTAMDRIASTGSVNISSEPPSIKGDQGDGGGGSKACIQRTITRNRARLKRVYENWLKRDPKLSGRIKISFTILPSGNVSNVRILSSSTGNGSFDSNILRYIQRWQFTACSIASPLEIELPFVFEGANG